MTDESASEDDAPSQGAPMSRREAAEARQAALARAEAHKPRTDEAGPADEPRRADEAGPADDGRTAPATDPGAVFQAHMRNARNEFESHVAQARSDFEEVNERIKQRTGRNLILAILIGLAFGGLLIVSLVFFKWVFVFLALAIALLGIFEFSRALTAAGRRVDVVPQLVAGAVLIASGYLLDLWLHWIAVFAAVALVVVWRLVAQMAARDGRTYGAVLSDVLVAGLIQLYVPFLTSLTVVLLRHDGGEWWVLAFIIVVAAADTGAYATGLSFGRTKMAPRISPNKTWEGFAGGATAAVAAGILLAIFMLGIDWWMGIILGLLVLGTATAGDLGESMIKRDLGIKDMSSWLPGHGGVLDRIDSILLSAVAALALFYIFTPLVTP